MFLILFTIVYFLELSATLTILGAELSSIEIGILIVLFMIELTYEINVFLTPYRIRKIREENKKQNKIIIDQNNTIIFLLNKIAKEKPKEINKNTADSLSHF